ncbi:MULTISPECIES: AAA family ATPase [Pseudanabaena]|jgi:predicted ATPase|uniref:AAA family ATPase n=1 Tax=Pseudanabaena TaxID=1152 RepID=UPI0024793C95|nr:MULTISPECIES: AAA family ATPase [Pseudanabaena]MEA5485514.1 AAA family ATPase [Pseudanabaena sp. CCNP1317]WGS70653.1 AAA family ATPase [Pseudanabaena galeata CCNP1313]
MSQQLTIHQFGPITNIKLDLNDILVFIGSQASGKSTVSKAIFFFKSLKDDLYRYYLDCYNQNKFDNAISRFCKLVNQKFTRIYGVTLLQSPNTKLTYIYSDQNEILIGTDLNGRINHIEFNSVFTISFEETINKLQDLRSELYGKTSNFSSSKESSIIKSKESALFEEINIQLNILFGDEREVIYLPAGRSLITTLSQQRYNIDMGDDLLSDNKLQSDNLIKLDYLMREFIDLIDQAKLVCKNGIDTLIKDYISEKNSSNDTSIKTIELAQGLINSILKGSYTYQNEIEKIEFADGKSTEINFASSGQQEVVWILLIIFLLILNDSKAFLIIEEPEAHLFPVAQKQIIDLISLFANYSKNQILLTTHSPYILSSFNNLLYAHKLGVEEDKKEVADIVDPHLWINPDRLDAYILEDGTARTIVDRKMGLIQSAEIDRASNIIVDTFNQLFDLED